MNLSTMSPEEIDAACASVLIAPRGMPDYILAKGSVFNTITKSDRFNPDETYEFRNEEKS